LLAVGDECAEHCGVVDDEVFGLGENEGGEERSHGGSYCL
jgi:hypothetical protein